MTAQTTQNETAVEILSDDEIAILNQARDVLNAFGKRCTVASWDAPRLEPGVANAADYGRVHAIAEAAEHALFTVLNWTASYYVRPLTAVQIHNHPEDDQ